jgi:hypothetical protein
MIGAQLFVTGYASAAPTARATFTGGIDGGVTDATFKIQLASETAGTSVTAKAGSFSRWREF